MKEEIALKWVAALRSGRYAQAKGCMKDSSGAMCCLGVLQFEVLNLDEPVAGILSTSARDAAGMRSTDGVTAGL